MSVTVNEVEITDEMIYAEMQYHPAGNQEEAQRQAIEALVVRSLLLQELKCEEPDNLLPEDEERLIEDLIKTRVALPAADEASCMHYYQSNEERFRDKKSGKVLPFDQVTEQVRDYLYTQSLYTGVNQYIKSLMDRAAIMPPLEA